MSSMTLSRRPAADVAPRPTTRLGRFLLALRSLLGWPAPAGPRYRVVQRIDEYEELVVFTQPGQARTRR